MLQSVRTQEQAGLDADTAVLFLWSSSGSAFLKEQRPTTHNILLACGSINVTVIDTLWLQTLEEYCLPPKVYNAGWLQLLAFEDDMRFPFVAALALAHTLIKIVLKQSLQLFVSPMGARTATGRALLCRFCSACCVCVRHLHDAGMNAVLCFERQVLKTGGSACMLDASSAVLPFICGSAFHCCLGT
jgi:hypothetical protein